jgi:hypothetical protein
MEKNRNAPNFLTSVIFFIVVVIFGGRKGVEIEQEGGKFNSALVPLQKRQFKLKKTTMPLIILSLFSSSLIRFQSNHV